MKRLLPTGLCLVIIFAICKLAKTSDVSGGKIYPQVFWAKNDLYKIAVPDRVADELHDKKQILLALAISSGKKTVSKTLLLAEGKTLGAYLDIAESELGYPINRQCVVKLFFGRQIICRKYAEISDQLKSETKKGGGIIILTDCNEPPPEKISQDTLIYSSALVANQDVRSLVISKSALQKLTDQNLILLDWSMILPGEQDTFYSTPVYVRGNQSLTSSFEAIFRKTSHYNSILGHFLIRIFTADQVTVTRYDEITDPLKSSTMLPGTIILVNRMGEFW